MSAAFIVHLFGPLTRDPEYTRVTALRIVIFHLPKTCNHPPLALVKTHCWPGVMLRIKNILGTALGTTWPLAKTRLEEKLQLRQLGFRRFPSFGNFIRNRCAVHFGPK